MRLPYKGKGVLGAVMLLVMLFASEPAFGQGDFKSQSLIELGLDKANIGQVQFPYTMLHPQPMEYGERLSRSIAPNDTLDNNDEERKTSSLTAGYISDVFSIQGADGSYRFRFDGETTGMMLSSRKSSLMLSYGFTDAQESEGEIRSITADLTFGGDIMIFRSFLGLPFKSYIPVRFNFGYRNLDLVDEPDSELNNTANIGSGSVGGGLGAEVRIPTGLPVLHDNITAFANLVTSVGAIGDIASYWGDPEPGDTVFGGIRLTKSTDLNIEAKFERLLGDNTGVTAGVTMRWLHWTRNDAENAKQILDIISGREDSLELRGTQTFFRIGINW